MSDFPYGELLPPAPNGFGPPCPRMCITRELLGKILNRRPRLRLKWKWRLKCGYATRKFGHRELTIKVLLCKSTGWWHARLFTDEDPWSGEFCDLSFALTPCWAIFPTAYTASIAAELFASGQNWDVAPLVWQDKNGDYHPIGKRQGPTQQQNR
jgi:hypothetical protein